MQTLGVIALVLGLGFLAAGMISFALNRGEPGSDEKALGKAGESGCDLFTPAEAAVEHSGATGGMDTGPAAAAHTAGT